MKLSEILNNPNLAGAGSVPQHLAEIVVKSLGFDGRFAQILTSQADYQITAVSEYRLYGGLIEGTYLLLDCGFTVALITTKGEVHWLDYDAVDSICQNILSKIPINVISNVDEDVTDTYSVNEPESLLDSEGFYKGERVSVKIVYVTSGKATPIDERRGDRPYYIGVLPHTELAGKIVVENEREERYTILVEDFKIPLRLGDQA